MEAKGREKARGKANMSWKEREYMYMGV